MVSLALLALPAPSIKVNHTAIIKTFICNKQRVLGSMATIRFEGGVTEGKNVYLYHCDLCEVKYKKASIR